MDFRYLIAGCLCALFFIQCGGPAPATPDAMDHLYPTGNKYATVLYAEEASEKDSSIRLIASHAVISRPSFIEWEKRIPEGGEYEVVIGYAVWNTAATVSITAGDESITEQLPVTTGVFEANDEWYNMNYERKLLKGELSLTEGANRIRLQIEGVNDSTSLMVYSVELMPVNKKKLAMEDVRRAVQVRPSTDWFSALRYGLMFHWTAQSAPRSGPIRPYAEAVNDFNVQAFADMVEATGAEYIIFTGNHAEPHFPGPLQNWEREYPGRTTKRDLIAEISDELEKRNIRFILYLATHIYAKQKEVDDTEFERLNRELVTEIGEHYGDKIDGYWLDGFYQSYASHPGFDFENFYKISKAGNPNRLLALNSWLYPVVSQWQDYWAGEVYTPSSTPSTRILPSGPGKGLPFQSLVVLENDWVHEKTDTKIPAPRLKAEQLINYISSCSGKGPVTINVGIYQDGSIGEAAFEELKKIKAAR